MDHKTKKRSENRVLQKMKKDQSIKESQKLIRIRKFDKKSEDLKSINDFMSKDFIKRFKRKMKVQKVQKIHRI